MDASPSEILKDLATQISTQQITAVLVKNDKVVEAALQVVRQSDFNPCHTLCVGFDRDKQSQKVGTRRRFLRQLLLKLQNSSVFEGPDHAKNLALSSPALRDDLYFEVGSLLALSLVHGGPPVAFISHALYYSLFHFPTDYKFTAEDLGDVILTHTVKKISQSNSLKELRKVVRSMMDCLQIAGCWREITKMSDKNLLLEDILNFYFVVRMQLPLQRFREGLRTLGVFDRVQACPEAFCPIFCGPRERMTAEAMFSLFTACFSEEEEQKAKENMTLGFWKQYIHECEDGRCAATLEDVLIFATGIDVVPAMNFEPPPSLSFFVPLEPSFAFPQSQTEINRLILPLLSSYELFKKHMEYAVCQISVMQGM